MERKARPSLRRDSGMNFPPTTYPENAPHSEPIFWDAVSVGRPLGKRVPPCVDAAHGRLKFDKHRIRFESKVCAENPRICFANPHRLRPPAGVLARGLKTLARFLYARALRRVRFSAVRTRNKKTGRYEYLPACYLWWRRGESNSGPRKPPDWHLQAQSLVLSRTLCAQRHARGVLTGSVLARAIPITCAGAFP